MDMVHNYAEIKEKVRELALSCRSDELILFEKNTFLKVCHVNLTDEENMDPFRFEKTSNLIKHFKLTCQNLDFRVSDLE